MQISYLQLKKMAKNLNLGLKSGDVKVSHSAILESFAKSLGFHDFNSLSAKMKKQDKAEYIKMKNVNKTGEK